MTVPMTKIKHQLHLHWYFSYLFRVIHSSVNNTEESLLTELSLFERPTIRRTRILFTVTMLMIGIMYNVSSELTLEMFTNVDHSLKNKYDRNSIIRTECVLVHNTFPFSNILLQWRLIPILRIYYESLDKAVHPFMNNNSNNNNANYTKEE